jgi:hypothetical protein
MTEQYENATSDGHRSSPKKNRYSGCNGRPKDNQQNQQQNWNRNQLATLGGMISRFLKASNKAGITRLGRSHWRRYLP